MVDYPLMRLSQDNHKRLRSMTVPAQRLFAAVIGETRDRAVQTAALDPDLTPMERQVEARTAQYLDALYKRVVSTTGIPAG